LFSISPSSTFSFFYWDFTEALWTISDEHQDHGEVSKDIEHYIKEAFSHSRILEAQGGQFCTLGSLLPLAWSQPYLSVLPSFQTFWDFYMTILLLIFSSIPLQSEGSYKKPQS
jgi:hypothetical protein